MTDQVQTPVQTPAPVTEAPVQGKDLLMSASFWGSIIGVVAMVLANYGMQINVSHTAADIVAFLGFANQLVGIVRRKTVIHSVAGIKIKKKA